MNRVIKTLVAGVATATLVGAPAIAMVGIGTAGAATAKVSPAARYNASITFGTGPAFSSPLRMTTAGKFTFTAGPHGTWTETGSVIHMTGTLDSTKFTFVIGQAGKNLGSATKPGKITVAGTQLGTWYAVRG
jgi:hypothetical protein